jgi:hypothetical protein
MWEEEVVVEFDLLSRHLLGVFEEKHGSPSVRIADPWGRHLKTEPPESELEMLSVWQRSSLVLLSDLNSLTGGTVITNAIKVRLGDTTSQYWEV